ncbi:MAG: MBOAT family protein [Acidimicrobiia bacterium]
MSFNSLVFGVFLAGVVVAYWLIPARFRTYLLLAASYLFYSWWDVRFLSLIVVSTLVDFVAGGKIAGATEMRARRRWMAVSLVVNLGILGFFKYWDFFVGSASDLLSSLGLESNLPLISVVLPVGVSFYTFQTLSYTVDVYRGRLEPEPNLARFALFVAFFPQLVAGPIERARHLLPQLRALPASRNQVDWRGSLTLIARGLFRKAVIADGVAPIVNQVFASPGRYGSLTLWIGVFAFSLQIYGDFAGYTDIARGTARLFGVDLMENFHAPYGSKSFSEFWRRWHISLSTWLRDYLYIPLGGNRQGRLRTYRNLMITMLLGGLWHGAAWGFVLWGGLHGLYLAVERLWRDRRGRQDTPIGLPAWSVFLIVTVTWIPFRAASLGSAVSILGGLVGSTGGEQLPGAAIVLALAGLATIWIDQTVLKGGVDPVAELPSFRRGLVYGTALVAAILLIPTSAVPFIYFQF